MVTPIMSIKYRHLYQFCYVKIFSTNQGGNLLLLEDPGRVRSQITNVVCQIQWFDFDCILAMSRKVIIRIQAVLGLKPLYNSLAVRPLQGFVPLPGMVGYGASVPRF